MTQPPPLEPPAFEVRSIFTVKHVVLVLSLLLNVLGGTSTIAPPFGHSPTTVAPCPAAPSTPVSSGAAGAP